MISCIFAKVITVGGWWDGDVQGGFGAAGGGEGSLATLGSPAVRVHLIATPTEAEIDTTQCSGNVKFSTIFKFPITL